VIELRAGAATDVGLVRSNNQDELLVATPLFAVADGMGGAAAGEVASATAVQYLRESFEAVEATPENLLTAAQTANRAVWDQAEANPEMRGMGTTLVALALVADGRLAAINVGDSRLYLLHDGELEQVTSDHNLVAELVAEGRLSPEEAEYHPRRNIMTRALGVDPDVPVDLFMLDAQPGDRFLLCSDGLSRELRDDVISSLLRRLADPEEAARELVNEAKRRGGNDNITVVVIDVLAPGGEEASAPTAEKDAAPPPPAPVEAPAPVAPAPKGRRRGAGLITPRVVAFCAVLVLLLAGAAAGVAWYARTGYYVGLTGNRITIFQGRPGGVLWFKPTVADDTIVTTAEVEGRHLSTLAAGQEESTLAAARQYVDRLVAEQQAAQAAALPIVPPTTIPARPRTTTPRTTIPAKPRTTTPPTT
jgi:serine/threonine protein phosphatase PrpC